MKINKILIALFTLICVVNFSSCVKDGDFSIPKPTSIPDVNLKETTTIKSLLDSYTDKPIFFSDDVIISGYVASNDETGNIFKSLVIQDAPENPTAGIAISIDQTGLFSTYELGRKVFVKLKGLVFSKSNNLPTIGAGIEGNFVTRITTPVARKVIVRTPKIVKITPKKVLISKLTNADLNQLVTIEKAQFINKELGLYYANPNNNDSENRTVIGCEDSGKIILRNSGYSSFKGVKLPEGSGSITGILSRYNNDVQLYIRGTEDVKFTENRCTPSYSDVSIETNTTINLVKQMYTDRIINITEDLVVKGYVTSDNSTGNIYKTLYIQDAPKNPKHAIQISVDDSNISKKYQVGRKVYLKLKGLYLDKVNGVLTIGSVKGLKLARISSVNIPNHIIAGKSETIVPLETTIEKILANDNLVSTLVKLNNIQLIKSQLGSAYANPNNTFNVNRTLESCDTKAKITIRNSGFSSFKNQEFPTGSGTITALVSKYKNTYQLFIRNTNDIKFTGERCDPPVLDCGEAPSMGNKIIYKEDFDNVSNLATAGWTNVNANGGSGLFSLRNYRGNSYVQASAYKSKEKSLEIWLVTPKINLDNSTDEILTFDTKTGFNNGAALSVWVSSNFTGDPKKATWLEINDAEIANGPKKGYQKKFTNSGSVNLSCLSGDVHIAFRYLGGGSITTTFQVDNVKVTGK